VPGSGAVAKFHIEDRKRDGDAAAVLEDVVGAGVVSVVVVFFVASEVEFVEQVLMSSEAEAAGVALADLAGVVVELSQPGSDGEIRELNAEDAAEWVH
jgi:hypothetical protein